VGGSLGLGFTETLPINDGSELILYGGTDGSFKDEIWKYTVETNSWKKYLNYSILILASLPKNYIFSIG